MAKDELTERQRHIAIIIAVIIGTLLAGVYIWFNPDYKYHGVAETKQEQVIALEGMANALYQTDREITYFNEDDDKLYYSFRSTHLYPELDYEEDHSFVFLLPIFGGVAYLFIRAMCMLGWIK